MGCKILKTVEDGADSQEGAVLFCSTTGWAFGPVFEDVDQAERFLEFLAAEDVEGATGTYSRESDPRTYTRAALELARERFLEGEEEEKNANADMDMEAAREDVRLVDWHDRAIDAAAEIAERTARLVDDGLLNPRDAARSILQAVRKLSTREVPSSGLGPDVDFCLKLGRNPRLACRLAPGHPWPCQGPPGKILCAASKRRAPEKSAAKKPRGKK